MQNDKENRFYGKNVDIERKNVEEFFKKRAQVASVAGDVVSMLYQDKNPELAIKRDKFEKNKFLALLSPQKHDTFIDLGCGIGRWTEDLAPAVDKYHGIDPVAELIAIAERNFRRFANVSFQVLPAEAATPERLTSQQKTFSAILNTGVLHYMNDVDCSKLIMNIPSLCESRTQN